MNYFHFFLMPLLCLEGHCVSRPDCLEKYLLAIALSIGTPGHCLSPTDAAIHQWSINSLLNLSVILS